MAKLKSTNEILHFLCDFLQYPKTGHGSLHDEIGNPHNGVMSTTQEHSIQNVGHSQGRAAAEQGIVSNNLNCQVICMKPMKQIYYELEQH